MTINGILSGLTSSGAGHALTRASAQIATAGRPDGPGQEIAEGSDPFGAAAVVELSASASASELSPEEQARVDELKQRDAEVRQHEAAHLAAAGAHAQGGPSFEYETGPDGRRYAVGGEVQIDTSSVADDPQATIAKMQQIRAAALAPADPSGQDQRVAAQAAAELQKAQVEQSRQRGEDSQGSGEAEDASGSGAAGPPGTNQSDPKRSPVGTLFSVYG